MATLEEASRCPKCREPGKKMGEKPSGNPGNKALIYHCENQTCKWGADPDDMGWIVEIDVRGNVSERTPGDKQFPEVPQDKELERRIQAIGEQYARPTNPRSTPEIGR
jgi:hypothetical protein